VTVTVKDAAGNVASCNATFTVSSSLPPVITTGPTVTNTLLQAGSCSVLVAGETNIFAVTATDPSGLPLAYQWQFGDGVTNAVSNVATAQHVYDVSTCGPYTASVTVSNGYAAVSSNLTASVACELAVSKLQVKADFNKWSNDTCKVTATLNLGSGFQPLGRTIVLNVGGALCSCTLDKKGHGANGASTCQLTYKKPTKTKPAYWTLTGTMKKGFWQENWTKCGMVNATIRSPGVPVTMHVIVLISNEGFAVERPLKYTATVGKTGMAK